MDPALPSELALLAPAALAAVSVATAVLVVGWPYAIRDAGADRLRAIRDERDRLRRRRREGFEGRGPSLVARPQRLFTEVVRRFRLDGAVEDGRLARTLARAGYRGRRPVYAYVAIRMLLPPGFLAAAALVLYGGGLEPVSLTTQLAILMGAGVAGYFAPPVFVRNMTDRRREAIVRSWPDALDLLLICIEAGMSIEVAFDRVADEMGAYAVELAEELHVTVAELAYLLDRRQAWLNLADRTGLYSVKALVSAFLQAEQQGASVGRALRVIASEERDRRILTAEKKAAALPPKLTVPMILFFMPVLFVVVLAPAVIRMMGWS